MKVDIPGEGELELKTLILDMNGTVAVKGQIVEGVKERLNTLKEHGMEIVLFSGDTRGNAAELTEELNIGWVQTATAEEKRDSAMKLNPETCVTIGNGLIDEKLFQTVRLSILTLQAEGVHFKTLQSADIITTSVLDALDLLIDERTLISTIRS